MSRTIFVNLPVADVEKSAEFYTALGFQRDPRFSVEGKAAAMTWSETISFMLLSHEYFATFTPRPVADAHQSTQALFCLSVDSREGVDTLCETVAARGGTTDIRETQDMGFLYCRAFADPDGHIFEPMFMDAAAAQAAMQPQNA